MKVVQIKYHETEEWLMNIHYAKRLPSITYSFGLFKDNVLIGIITYGMPVSHTLCEGICGKEYKDNVLELNRLCLLHNRKNEASFLVGNYSLEERKANPDKFEIVQRTRKHRYIYFLADKNCKKDMNKKLNYKIHDYPKGENKKYDVGHIPKVQGLLF